MFAQKEGKMEAENCLAENLKQTCLKEI